MGSGKIEIIKIKIKLPNKLLFNLKIMKKSLTSIILILIGIASFAQENPFNGTYKGSSDGIPYTLYLKNNNGIVTGSIRNSERASIESTISASVSNTNYIKGIQKGKRSKIKFMAIEEKDEIIWEMRSRFIKRIFSKKTKIIKYARVGSAANDSFDNQQDMDENGLNN